MEARLLGEGVRLLDAEVTGAQLTAWSLGPSGPRGRAAGAGRGGGPHRLRGLPTQVNPGTSARGAMPAICLSLATNHAYDSVDDVVRALWLRGESEPSRLPVRTRPGNAAASLTSPPSLAWFGPPGRPALGWSRRHPHAGHWSRPLLLLSAAGASASAPCAQGGVVFQIHAEVHQIEIILLRFHGKADKFSRELILGTRGPCVPRYDAPAVTPDAAPSQGAYRPGRGSASSSSGGKRHVPVEPQPRHRDMSPWDMSPWDMSTGTCPTGTCQRGRVEG